MDHITLDTMQFPCIIGILPRERVTEQPLDVRIRLGLDLDRSGDDDDLTASVNYAAVCDQFTFMVVEGKFLLLESLGVAAARWLLADPAGEPRAAVSAVELEMRKPEVLDGRAVPGVVVRRESGWSPPVIREVSLGVAQDVMLELSDLGVYRLRLAPGRSVTLPAGSVALGAWGPTGERFEAGATVEAGRSPVHLLVVSRPPWR